MAFNPISNHIYRFAAPQIQTAIHHGRERGRGGFGVVYRGTIRRQGEGTRATAFKMVLRGDAFRQEVTVLDLLQNEHVIGFLGVCEEFWTIVLEYAQNHTLRYHLGLPNSTRTFQWCAWIKVLVGLCRALAHVHRCGYIHRDVKSDNV